MGAKIREMMIVTKTLGTRGGEQKNTLPVAPSSRLDEFEAFLLYILSKSRYHFSVHKFS
jgi:hypothetical protein